MKPGAIITFSKPSRRVSCCTARKSSRCAQARGRLRMRLRAWKRTRSGFTTSTLTNTRTAICRIMFPKRRAPAALGGRLFAVFDRLQYLALGAVNAGVVERYYASASTTPALVMGRLFRNAQFHLAKAEGGVAGNAAKDFEAITCALGDQFPATLDLESQGRFALGYYHQKAEYRRRTAERKEKEIAEAAK